MPSVVRVVPDQLCDCWESGTSLAITMLKVVSAKLNELNGGNIFDGETCIHIERSSERKITLRFTLTCLPKVVSRGWWKFEGGVISRWWGKAI